MAVVECLGKKGTTMNSKKWRTHNAPGSKRVIVTKELPGSLWLQRLIRADCKVEVCTSTDVLRVDDIKAAIGQRCDAVLGQLTEDWGDELFGVLKASGGSAYSNVAGLMMGYPVWNRPDILPFLENDSPQAAPSIVNADALNLAICEDR
jgi:hypothetical protein